MRSDSVERWEKTIWSEWYEVSDHGSVRTVSHVVIRSNGRRLTVRGKMLNPYDSGSGPMVCIASPNGDRREHYVRRLVLEAFVGPAPEGMEACHFPDRDPWNNRLKNLRWDTKKGNSRDKVLHGTVFVASGELNGESKLTSEQVVQIRIMYATGKYLQSELASEFGVVQVRISGIVSGKSWKHIGGPITKVGRRKNGIKGKSWLRKVANGEGPK